ncbi:nuclease-related domain-containing protein [Streptomyces sp. NPDC058572]|uniref:nuclease-related domain-containing protein n=1 Tax=Streptomyces sp. NPDC058572 TaxID=3346546 RepID=UPI003657611D
MPLLAAAAAVVGSAVGALTNWQLGLVAGLVVVGLGARRLYRRAHNSWVVGAAGEARTARLLAPLVRKGHAVVLHDRAVPNSRANLDHLVFTVAGAAYVDTKNWTSGKSRLTVQGGILRYGRYDQSRALQTVVWEAEQAARVLGIPVRPVVAVHGAKVPAPRGRMEIGGVTVVEAKRLRGLLRSLPPQPGWDSARMAAVGQQAEQALPPAH